MSVAPGIGKQIVSRIGIDKQKRHPNDLSAKMGIHSKALSQSEKMKRLRAHLRRLGNVLIAFSGGVDSSFLAAVACRELGGRVLAVTALSPLCPASEGRFARELASRLGMRHKVIRINPLKDERVAANTPSRCYYCKSELFRRLRRIAVQNNIARVLDGTNADDTRDFRPGLRAAAEFGALSPLKDENFTKTDIRILSKALGLPTGSREAMPCLATRFPYGERITARRIKSVAFLEDFLRKSAFRRVRVRSHGRVARIEVDCADIGRLCSKLMRAEVSRMARLGGFVYVAADLDGYRSGSMNEELAVMEDKLISARRKKQTGE